MRKHVYAVLTALWIILFAWSLWVHHPAPADPAKIIANGYGGPMELQMGISREGKIASLAILKHDETSSYLTSLDSFIRQFIGRGTESPLILGKDIDAITGATITSNAITAAVRQERNRVLKLPESSHTPEADITKILIPLALLILAIAAFIARHNPLRWAVLIGSMIYFGLMHHTMLSIIQIVQASLWHIPAFFNNPLWWMILGITLLSTLCLGRIYCGSLCPFASVQEFLFQLTRRKRPASALLDINVDYKARSIKYALLFIIIILSCLMGNSKAANIEPFITLFEAHGTKLSWAFLTLMLIMAVFNFRFWCKYLCPVGALTSLVAIFSFWKIRANAACTHCSACQQACPTAAISTDSQGIPQIDPAECIACAKCLRACPQNALKLRCGHVA